VDIKNYIESGVLEEYCLGLLNEEEQSFLIQMTLLYPEIKAELNAVEKVMENLAIAAAVEPAPGVKDKVLALLGFESEPVHHDINNLPAVDKNSDRYSWIKTLNHLIPAEPTEDFWCELIRKDDQYQQMLVITNMDVPEEEHGEYLESFFILKGQCECMVGSELFTLNAGNFLQIPLHVQHNIKITSPYVVAILQHQYV
jgi:mannose-6-phosphate isomerase-like protein (cupin superfamily)